MLARKDCSKWFFMHIQSIDCVLFAFSLAGAVFTYNSLEHEGTLFVTGDA